MSLPNELSENSEKITIKKSTYNSLIIGAVIAIAAATFFVGFLAGSSPSDISSDNITKSEIKDLIEKLDSVPTAAQPTQPAAQPASQPTQPAGIGGTA